jgi:archaellum component FlaC
MVRKLLKVSEKVRRFPMTEMKKVAVIPTEGNGNAEQGAGNVDKIREILFGSQIKNYETRFARLEDTLARETAELKDTMRRRFESVEGFFRKEADALSGRLKAEKEERTEALKSIARDLKSATDTLSKKILELDDKTAEGVSGMRQELMQESRKLLEEIRQKSDSLSALVERRSDELRNHKLDRAALASLLTEMALQLSEDGGARGKPVKAAKIAGQ